MTLKPIRVLIVAASSSKRNRIADLLFFVSRAHVVGKVSGSEEALELVASGMAEPDVVLLDFPILRGRVATICDLRDAFPSAEVVALVSFLEGNLVEEALHAGAIGCLSRDDLTTAVLFKAILFAYNGMAFRASGESTVPAVPAAARGPNVVPIEHDLTERELEILKLLVMGLSYQRIAEQLFILQATVRFHARSIRSKLRTRTRAETVAYALQHQLVR